MIKKSNKTILKAVSIAAGFFMSLHAMAEAAESATLSFGDEDYILDFVLCYQERDGSLRIDLGDKKARSDYPSISIWLYADQPDAAKPQIFSVNFYRADPRTLWRFEEGMYQKTPEGFTASGELNGTVLDKEAERYMTPMEVDKNKKFTLNVTCNDY